MKRRSFFTRVSSAVLAVFGIHAVGYTISMPTDIPMPADTLPSASAPNEGDLAYWDGSKWALVTGSVTSKMPWWCWYGTKKSDCAYISKHRQEVPRITINRMVKYSPTKSENCGGG